ncbi:MAG: hypothetical protein V4570_09205 [Pseudomonadota bacterium]
MYKIHPSRELNNLFKYKPYQGVEPSLAHFLFIGLDANYQADIESKEIFKQVTAYHEDSVKFWQKYNVHHPFLLSDYHGDGQRYHRNFSKIGFKAEHANQISFIELLHVPTVGRNKLHASDLDENHLATIDDAILYGKPKHIFASANVLQLIRDSKKFSWLSKTNQTKEVLPVIFSKNEKSMYKHLHFSNYRNFQLQMEKEASAIFNLI